MKYIKELEVQNADKEEIEFDKNGKQTIAKSKVYAKINKTEKGVSYFIATYNNQIYDPIGISSNRERYLDMKLKRVSKDTFDFYMIYLQTNNSIYLTRANRRFINE